MAYNISAITLIEDNICTPNTTQSRIDNAD